MGSVGASAVITRDDGSHVERTLSHRRKTSELNAQIRHAQLSRFLIVTSAVLGFLVVASASAVTASTWRQLDMRPYNVAGLVILGLLLVVCVIGRRMRINIGSGSSESGTKSLSDVKLELELLEERRILEAGQGARSSKDRQYSYRESIPQEIERLRRETRSYRRVHNFFQWGLFFASVAMMVTSGVYEPPQPGKAILIGLGAFVAFTTAVTGYFKYRERAFNLQQTSDAIEQHVTAYGLAIPPYNQGDDAVNLERLAENVEALRVEQRKRQQQLEQPNQGQQEVI
ncbi:SLATT domain-containing protein [Streptomyces sp. PmtG]